MTPQKLGTNKLNVLTWNAIALRDPQNFQLQSQKIREKTNIKVRRKNKKDCADNGITQTVQAKKTENEDETYSC